MNENECKVCTKMIKEKYKSFKTWKTLAIVFMCLTVLFAILYFSSGNLLVEEITENNIRIENTDGENQNNIVTGNGSTISGTIKTESNIGTIIFVCVIILVGGFVYGCYVVSQKKGD
ncbi:MAG: hypothetical protein IKW45_06430 [Clostridia bacterium]|nr:hypothetical protein [Clostridia bacterium]